MSGNIECLLKSLKASNPLSDLHESVVEGNEEKVKLILESRSHKINERNVLYNGRAMLHEAVFYGHLSITKLLLQHNADPNCRTYIGKETPLHFAVIKDERKIAYELLNRGANPNATNKYLNTPLFYAKKKGMAYLLCDRGASLLRLNIDKKTPLDVTSEFEDKDGKELNQFLKLKLGQP